MATTDDLRLDGNAVAGLLGELFAADVTAALVGCATCGAVGPVATVQVYAHGPGVVLRCPGCTGVILRVARIRGELVADLRGVGTLRLSEG